MLGIAGSLIDTSDRSVISHTRVRAKTRDGIQASSRAKRWNTISVAQEQHYSEGLDDIGLEEEIFYFPSHVTSEPIEFSRIAIQIDCTILRHERPRLKNFAIRSFDTRVTLRPILLRRVLTRIFHTQSNVSFDLMHKIIICNL